MIEGVELVRDRLLEIRKRLLAQLGEAADELKRIDAALRALSSGETCRRPSIRRLSGGTAERAIAALVELGKPSTAPQVAEQMVRSGWIVTAARPEEYVRNALTRAISTGEVCRPSRGRYAIVSDVAQPKDA